MNSKDEWMDSLSGGQRGLVKQAYRLLEESGTRNQESGEDFSFVVFPMAKAFEGFLKKVFLEKGLIDQKTYNGDRFRIGKALNPNMPQKHRGRWWLWDDLVKMCDSDEVAKVLWKAWRECRNQIFHYFPGHTEAISLSEAKEKIQQLKIAMISLLNCKIGNNE